MKVSLEELKKIVLEEAVVMSELDRSSSAADFDSPAELKKLRKAALDSIKELPVDHPDLERHVNDLMMRLGNASTEEELEGVRKAADDWHDRARQLMGWIHRGEYEESTDMTESQKDGTRRKSLKDVLDHFRPEDVVHTVQDAWAGGGEDALNLVAPLDHVKRQTGEDAVGDQEFMVVADEPNAGYPALPLQEAFESLSTMGRYSPENHLAPHRPMSAMKSLVDIMLEQEEQEVEASQEEFTIQTSDDEITSNHDMQTAFLAHANTVFGKESGQQMLSAWLGGQQGEELSTFDSFMEEMGYALNKEDFASEFNLDVETDVRSDVPVKVDEKETPEYAEETNLLLGDTSEGEHHDSDESLSEGATNDRWLEMAGIFNN